MKVINLIHWIQKLGEEPKEKFKGETGYMIHDITVIMWRYIALQNILKEKNIKITLKEWGKNLYKNVEEIDV